MQRYAHPNLGRLVQPRHYSSIEATADAGVPWAADNDAFHNFDAAAYTRMIDRLAGIPGCLFVTAPDVVGDAAATDALFCQWRDTLAARRLPVGYVAQDGATTSTVPWNRIDAVFIGGSTTWKLGAEARIIAAEAKRRGKWLHMGRVNGPRRMLHAARLGCDSIDGSSWARWKRVWLLAGLDAASSAAAAARDQLTLAMPVTERDGGDA
jgi:hypothetical protein